MNKKFYLLGLTIFIVGLFVFAFPSFSQMPSNFEEYLRMLPKPTTWPEDAPLYPGAKPLIPEGPEIPGFPFSNPGEAQTEWGLLKLYLLVTEAASETVVSWYKGNLPQYGWAVISKEEYLRFLELPEVRREIPEGLPAPITELIEAYGKTWLWVLKTRQGGCYGLIVFAGFPAEEKTLIQLQEAHTSTEPCALLPLAELFPVAPCSGEEVVYAKEGCPKCEDLTPEECLKQPGCVYKGDGVCWVALIDRVTECLVRERREDGNYLCQGQSKPPDYVCQKIGECRFEALEEICQWPVEVERKRAALIRQIKEEFGFTVKDSELCGEEVCEEENPDDSVWTTEELQKMVGFFEELPKCFLERVGRPEIMGRPKDERFCCQRILGGRPGAYVSGAEEIVFCGRLFLGMRLEGALAHELTHLFQNYDIPPRYKNSPVALYTNPVVIDWIKQTGWAAGGYPVIPFSEVRTVYIFELPPDLPTDYVRKSANPLEDMAESVRLYVTDPEKLLEISPRRYDFIKEKIMCGEEYK